LNGPESSVAGLQSVGGVGRAITAAGANGHGLLCGHSSANTMGLSPNDHVPLHATHSGPASFNSSNNSMPTSQGGPQMPNFHRKLIRSASLTPPISATNPTNPTNLADWLKLQDESEKAHGTGSSAMHHEHAPLSPQSSVTSSGSGSDTHLDDASGQSQHRNTFLEDGSGMKDVPIWLKSLRLHKYSYLFQQMTYEEMLTLTESWLDAQGVTRGARHKIVLSIGKLKERQNVLRAMEKEIMETGCLKQALSEIKSMLNTPIKGYSPTSSHVDSASDSSQAMDTSEAKTTPPQSPSLTEGDSIPEGDLPGQLTRVLGKVCTQLLVTSRPEDECFAIYLQLLDKCMMHQAFTSKQKKLLASWKQQIQKIWQMAPHKYSLDKQRRSFGNTFPLGSVNRQRPMRGQQARPGQPQWTFNKRPPLGPSVSGGNLPLHHATTAFSAVPHLYELKQPVQRTHSAPIRSSQFGLSLSAGPAVDRSVTEPEINAQLDSLCLSMTEHALDGFDNPDRGSTF